MLLIDLREKNRGKFYGVRIESLENSARQIETMYRQIQINYTVLPPHFFEAPLVRKERLTIQSSITLLNRCRQLLESVHIFLRDVYDHTIQVVDTIESMRDVLSGLSDLYLSTVSNRMNEVMKVLTIIATIFIPLTFIAGIYGMNFEFMPELKWRWSYPVLWIILVVIFIAMLA